jgi:ABC-2 type transport system ATP-binding protein
MNESKDPAHQAPVINVRGVSKWFGSVVAVNDVTLQVHPGITGLLGPNGAGKSTILHMITGKAACSEGDVTVLGQSARDNPELYRSIGVMSEHEAVYGFQTGRQFIEFTAALHGLSPMAGPVDRAIGLVGLEDAQHRKLGTYSRGMRQRMRLAAALVHDPQVLVLDEPLNGTDPRQRLDFHDAMARLAEQGRTILISSHILEEIETLASTILLMVSGKLAAAGDFRAIREKLDEQAYKVRVVTTSPRAMASALMAMEEVDSVSVGPEEGELIALSRNVNTLQLSIPRLAQEHGIRLLRVEPLDDSLESIFSYVVER